MTFPSRVCRLCGTEKSVQLFPSARSTQCIQCNRAQSQRYIGTTNVGRPGTTANTIPTKGRTFSLYKKDKYQYTEGSNSSNNTVETNPAGNTDTAPDIGTVRDPSAPQPGESE